jgi:ABC-type Fe3+ transport system permease subunit
VERTWTELPTVFRAVTGVIWNSFAFSAITASVCVIIALAGKAVQDPRSKDRSFGTLDFGLWTLESWLHALLWLPLLMPGVLLGIGLIFIFNRPVFEVIYHGPCIVLVALTIRYLVLGWNGVGFALHGVDRDLTDAARLSGASGWSLLRHVHWPQIAHQIGAVWYVTYLLSLWDVETIILIQPPGGETLALRIFNLLHYGHNAQVNALCLLLLALAVAPLAAWSLWRRIAHSQNV